MNARSRGRHEPEGHDEAPLRKQQHLLIEAGTETNFLQTGEAKYGKPILDLAVTPAATLEDATKRVLASFDSTMPSNLSVGMAVDLPCYARDSLKVTMKRRFESGDSYFEALKQQWIAGTRKVFHNVPPLQWWRRTRQKPRHPGNAGAAPARKATGSSHATFA